MSHPLAYTRTICLKILCIIVIPEKALFQRSCVKAPDPFPPLAPRVPAQRRGVASPGPCSLKRRSLVSPATLPAY